MTLLSSIVGPKYSILVPWAIRLGPHVNGALVSQANMEECGTSAYEQGYVRAPLCNWADIFPCMCAVLH
jgi:hypothetical protein